MSARKEESEHPWTPLERALLAAFLVIASASLVWLVHPWYERANDASLYVLTARALATGASYTYLGEPFTVRPPGFSALLAPLCGGARIDFHALNLLVSVWGIAALALLFVWTRVRLGAWLAFALCLVVWFAPPWQRLCNMVLSDVPGTALLIGCLLVERWSARRPSARRDLLLGLAIGAVSLVRTMNVLLAPAIVVATFFALRSDGARGADLLKRLARRTAPLALGVVLVLAPWSLWASANRPEPPVDQTYLHSYSSAMWNEDWGDPNSPLRPISDLWERIPDRGEKLLALLGSRMQAAETGWVELALGGLVLAGALVIAWRRRESAEWFVLGASALLLVFVSFLDRHALPIWVLALAAALEALLLLLAKLGAKPPTARAIAVAMLAGVLWVDWSPRKGWPVIEESHRQMESYCASVAPKLPPTARPAAQLGWHYSVYLDRPVWSLMFAEARHGQAGIDSVLEKYAIDTLLLCDIMKLSPGVEEHLAPRVVAREDVELGSVLRLK